MSIIAKIWQRKYSALILLAVISVLIAFRIIYVNQSRSVTIKNVQEGKHEWEESNKERGLVDYGNGTWGPPIIKGGATNGANTNVVKTTNQ
jgi:hypothetical protein